MSDNTCYIGRSEVRQIIMSKAPEGVARKLLAEIDHLTISTATDFRDHAPTLPASRPTDAQTASACMSYRHDFGLLDATAQQTMKRQAYEWLRAWQKEFESSDGESGCPRKCGEADDSAGSGNDRNCDDTMQGSRPAAVVKVPPSEAHQSAASTVEPVARKPLGLDEDGICQEHGQFGCEQCVIAFVTGNTTEPVAWEWEISLGFSPVRWMKHLTDYRPDDASYVRNIRPLYAAPTTSPEPDAVREALDKAETELLREYYSGRLNGDHTVRSEFKKLRAALTPPEVKP